MLPSLTTPAYTWQKENARMWTVGAKIVPSPRRRQLVNVSRLYTLNHKKT